MDHVCDARVLPTPVVHRQDHEEGDAWSLHVAKFDVDSDAPLLSLESKTYDIDPDGA